MANGFLTNLIGEAVDSVCRFSVELNKILLIQNLSRCERKPAATPNIFLNNSLDSTMTPPSRQGHEQAVDDRPYVAEIKGEIMLSSFFTQGCARQLQQDECPLCRQRKSGCIGGLEMAVCEGRASICSTNEKTRREGRVRSAWR